MATKKLQDLTVSTNPNDTDILLIEDTAATKKITFLNLFNKVKAKLGLATVATSGKLADTVKDANNRTTTDKEKEKWNGYEEEILSLNRKLLIETVGISNAYTTNCTFHLENCYFRGNEEVFLQFNVRSNVTLPTGTNLFRLSTSRAYPAATRQVPAIVCNNSIYMPWHVEVTSDGYIRQNAGSAVTEIWVCGSYII